MKVPTHVLAGAEAALELRTGRPESLRAAGSIGGGCINPSARLESEKGESFFLKWNDAADPTMFEAEADGLSALGRAKSLRVPEVLGWGGQCTRTDPGWLLLEFVPPGAGRQDYGQALGAGLAALHESPALASADLSIERGMSGGYGWHRDNFIGSLPQENLEGAGWAVFWRDLRIEPQLKLARDRGFFSGGRGKVLDDLLARMEEILPSESESGPGLLHGDLWSGNYYADGHGAPVIIDPAVYLGEGEVDLAMMELFGSFPRGFADAYHEVRPIPPEYQAFRRDLYQLYYLLVHVNLFGGSYEGGSLSAAKRVLSAI